MSGRAKRAGKPLRRAEVLLLAAAVGLTVIFVLYVTLFERDWGLGLLKATFGLSGGTTAGG